MGLSANAAQPGSPRRRIGVFGGTFDPIHRGHLQIARFALAEAGLDQVLLVPAGRPWLRDEQPVASAEHRLRMTELAVSGVPGLEVSDVDVARAGATYTVDTLTDLEQRYGPQTELVLVLGADSALSMDRWKRAADIRGMCSVLVIGRAGEAWPPDQPPTHPAAAATYLEGPMLEVSATGLRARLASGEDVSDSVAGPVLRYIWKHGLYGAEAGGSTGKRAGMVQTASGAERLIERATELGALEFGEFTLASGQKSSYYFDGRRLSLDPEGAHIISGLFLSRILEAGCEAAGGPTVAAVPIAGALALRSWQEGVDLTGFFVRPAAKGHGMGRQIEGSVKPGMRVAVFDDTVSTGGSLLEALEAVQAFGCEVGLVLCVLDRKQGGSDEVRRRGLEFASLWEASPEGEIRVTGS